MEKFFTFYCCMIALLLAGAAVYLLLTVSLFIGIPSSAVLVAAALIYTVWGVSFCRKKCQPQI